MANEALAREVAGLDAVVGVAGGRQMQPIAVQGPEGQVVLHASYFQGEYLGQLTLQLDAQGRVVTFSGLVLALDPKYADDAAVAQMMLKHGVKPK